MSDALWFSRTQLARMLGVTLPTISTAIDEGAPGVQKAGGRGKTSKIDATEFIPWYLERERARIRAESAGKKASEIERDLDIELKREKLARERKELVPRAAFVHTLRDILARLSVQIDQLPDREADAVIGLRDRASAEAALRLIGDQLRNDLRAPEMWTPGEPPQLELSA